MTGMHRVTWLDTGASFQATPGELLLDAALRAGLALPHDCRAGGCGTCRVRLLQGQVAYDDTPFALSEAEQAAGQALACQGRVHGDLVFSAAPAVAVPAFAQPRRCTARVLARTPLAPGVTRLLLRTSDEVACDWLPGQHLDLLLPGGQRRSFSMANAPGQGLLELHVRHVAGGWFSGTVLPGWRAGDLVEVELPLGRFYWHPEHDLPMLLVATGTGIAPIKAMLELMLRRGDAPPAALYWGVRERGGHYLDAQVATWSRELFEFRYVPVLSRPDSAWPGRPGHVQQAVLQDLPSLAGHAIYLCGSPAMVRDASQAFLAHGADAAHLYTDSFVFQHDAAPRHPTADVPQAA
jgi:CDP-4-dehydro-6-deoxyglucose reductase